MRGNPSYKTGHKRQTPFVLTALILISKSPHVQ